MNRKLRIGLLLSLLMVFISHNFEPYLGKEGATSNASPDCGVELLESHLKWLVDTSDLSGGVKQSLLSKLGAAGAMIDKAYSSGNLNKLHGAVGSLNSFINELDEGGEASTYPDSAIWMGQAEFIVERIELVLS